MFNPTNQWPETQAGLGTKFFAQAMRAFLDKESFEGFRAYSLDTMGRLREAEALVQEIIEKRVKEAALGPVMEELIWSIQNDGAALSLAPTACQTVIELCENVRPRKHILIRGISLLIRSLQDGYRTALVDRVINSINSDKRIEILAATGFLVSHLINEGHNRDFLIYRIDEKFFSEPVKKAGASIVRAFLRGITETRREWIVILLVNAAAKSLLQSFKTWRLVEPADLPAHAHAPVAAWAYMEGDATLALKRSVAADPFQASVDVRAELEQVKSLRILAVDPIKPTWSAHSYVYAPRAAEGNDLVTWDAPLIGPRKPKPLSGHRLVQARNIAARLYQNFDDVSKERITRALSTAAVAIDTPQEEIRITSLWASFEVLLGDPPEEEARISHFIRTLYPCISIRYHRRLFVTLHDQLAVHYKKRFRQILSEVKTDIKSNPHTRFCKLVSLPEYRGSLERLFELASVDPFLVHRLWRLYRYYGNPKDCLRSLEGHSARVVWQLNRIYRVRNSLVHAGRSPAYTDTLVLNSLDYLRSAVLTVVRMSTRPGASRALDQTIAEIGFEWSAMLNRLDTLKNKEFDEQSAHSIFSAL